MKSIFQLFDVESNQEIDIKQINHLLRELEILNY
jgi:Ca2+-binding EF-hand superfamily protein